MPHKNAVVKQIIQFPGNLLDLFGMSADDLIPECEGIVTA